LLTPPCPGDYKPTIRGRFRPSLTAHQNLDLEKYKGLWYQMYRVNSTTNWGDCSTAKYERSFDSNGYLAEPYSLKITNKVYPFKF
jgi:hypothetical protein